MYINDSMFDKLSVDTTQDGTRLWLEIDYTLGSSAIETLDIKQAIVLRNIIDAWLQAQEGESDN